MIRKSDWTGKGKKKKTPVKYNSDFLKNFVLRIIHTLLFTLVCQSRVLNTCYRVILCPNMGKNFLKEVE